MIFITTILAVFGACVLILLIGLVVYIVVAIVKHERYLRKLPPGEGTGPEIESWEAYELPDHLVISGRIGCHVGRVVIRLYDGEGESRRYLGTATGTVYSPHNFYTVADEVRKPDSLSIEYTIHDYIEEEDAPSPD